MEKEKIIDFNFHFNSNIRPYFLLINKRRRLIWNKTRIFSLSCEILFRKSPPPHASSANCDFILSRENDFNLDGIYLFIFFFRSVSPHQVKNISRRVVGVSYAFKSVPGYNVISAERNAVYTNIMAWNLIFVGRHPIITIFIDGCSVLRRQLGNTVKTLDVVLSPPPFATS